MTAIIRPMGERDREAVLDMMRVFYRSPAVLSDGSEEIFRSDVDACIGECPFLEGYVFVSEENSILGYAMLAKSFSTEFGKPCIWVEDLYMLPEARGLGLGTRFFCFAEEKYPDAIFRLEVEEENRRALRVYRKNGYEVLGYMEMKKDSRM